MLSIKEFNYKGQNISQRDDGFINLTQMCQANGKRLDKFMKALKTKEYIDTLSQSHHMGVVDSINGGSNPGTWGHPSLAINLARWISSEFAVWCDSHIFNLMSTGSTSLEINPIEEMRLKIELAKLENNKVQAELGLLQLRQYIVTALPEPVQQKILGYQLVEKIEYRDRIIQDKEILHDGSTITKTDLCKRYGFTGKTGAPDYKRLNKMMESVDLPSEAWELKARIQDTQELRREYLAEVDRQIIGGDRQMWIGE